ncbi:helix-turn-helix transcriptional regulator [Actinopolyspora alba]|uniref:helix-turn-helix transcriptional regulator n=1 Tax=Actinopolyspora alba TaxID=673379 RepID=UPI000B82FDB5|nr:helix-turn-helix domain-containing protein [Actinopolyspora alba]
MRDDQPLATRQEVADHVGVPVGTLAAWAYRGTGPRYIRVGRHARYRWSDVEKWLDQHTEGAA